MFTIPTMVGFDVEEVRHIRYATDGFLSRTRVRVHPLYMRPMLAERGESMMCFHSFTTSGSRSSLTW